MLGSEIKYDQEKREEYITNKPDRPIDPCVRNPGCRIGCKRTKRHIGRIWN